MLTIKLQWESAEMLTTISMNRQPIPIRRNLWLALSHLRDLEKPRVLWIDALCIDQKNNDERSSQVSLMHKIYSSASKVLAWLGAEEDRSNAAVEGIELLAKRIQDHRSKHQNDDARRADGTAILSLFRRNYWSRVWIIQELRFTSNIELHCGSRTLSWQALRAVISEKHFWKLPSTWWDDETPLTIWEDAIAFTPASTLVRLKKGRATTLKDLLYLHRKSLCADPRDRVYGLLNIASDCQNGGIKADYTKSAYQLYVDVMAWCLDPSRRNAHDDILGLSTLLLDALQDPFWDQLGKQYVKYSQLAVGNPHLIFTIRGQIQSNTVSLGAPMYLGGSSIAIDPSSIDKFVKDNPFDLFHPIYFGRSNKIGHKSIVQYKDLEWDVGEEAFYKMTRGDWMGKKSLPFSGDTFGKMNACLVLSKNFIGLSSCVIEERDLICEFPNCGGIALIRPHTHDSTLYTAVGRVLDLRHAQFRTENMVDPSPSTLAGKYLRYYDSPLNISFYVMPNILKFD
jgi:hypothetical protein